jgi:G:T/U-mismatch repair DNA glycosylase
MSEKLLIEAAVNPVEQHPLSPFLPSGSRLLMLGSFPPPKKRWSMEFYYPNMQNDMWRIFGIIFFSDKNHFIDEAARSFRKDLLVPFLEAKGIALYDTASAVRRLNNDASDKFLEVVTPSDIPLLLRCIPQCRAVAVTGQKALDTVTEQLRPYMKGRSPAAPPVGSSAGFIYADPLTGIERQLRLYRMPSSSRAYPLPLEAKADCYRSMAKDLDLLSAN